MCIYIYIYSYKTSYVYVYMYINIYNEVNLIINCGLLVFTIRYCIPPGIPLFGRRPWFMTKLVFDIEYTSCSYWKANEQL